MPGDISKKYTGRQSGLWNKSSHGQHVVRREIDPDSLTAEERRRRRVTANQVLNVLKWALRAAFDEGRIKNDWAWRSVKGSGMSKE